MKRDLNKAMNIMTVQKSNANIALIKLGEIRKENADLKNKLQMYRKMMNESLKARDDGKGVKAGD